MKASVIVCTRNPKPEALGRLWEALAGQVRAAGRWELVVVDNGSGQPVALPAPAFTAARVVREEEPGLTPARLRGIRESRNELLIFFDDDNVPDPDYVIAALTLFGGHPSLGVAGGRIDGEFEREPPAWAGPYLGWLAVRPGVTAERTFGPGDAWSGLPCGAGFCIRADAARMYAEALAGNPERRSFDRRGEVLTGSGDTDLALAALDIGYEARLSPSLRLRHLIPAARLEPEYLERLLEGSAYSTVRLARMRRLPQRPFWLNRLLRRIKRCLFAPAGCREMRCRMERAVDRGERRAREEKAGAA